MYVIRKRGLAPRHHCPLPGFWSRLWQGLHEGALLKCKTCSTQWELKLVGMMEPELMWVQT